MPAELVELLARLSVSILASLSLTPREHGGVNRNLTEMMFAMPCSPHTCGALLHTPDILLQLGGRDLALHSATTIFISTKGPGKTCLPGLPTRLYRQECTRLVV